MAASYAELNGKIDKIGTNLLHLIEAQKRYNDMIEAHELALNTIKIERAAEKVAYDSIGKQVNAMYKLFVSGNGTPSLAETLRTHCAWIEAHEKQENKEEGRRWEIKKTYIGLSIGWILTLIGLGVAIFT